MQKMSFDKMIWKNVPQKNWMSCQACVGSMHTGAVSSDHLRALREKIWAADCWQSLAESWRDEVSLTELYIYFRYTGAVFTSNTKGRTERINYLSFKVQHIVSLCVCTKLIVYVWTPVFHWQGLVHCLKVLTLGANSKSLFFFFFKAIEVNGAIHTGSECSQSEKATVIFSILFF